MTHPFGEKDYFRPQRTLLLFFGFDYNYAIRFSSSDIRKNASCSSWVAGNGVFCHEAVWHIFPLRQSCGNNTQNSPTLYNSLSKEVFVNGCNFK